MKSSSTQLPQQEISDGGEDTADYIDRHLVAALVQHSIAIKISDEEINQAAPMGNPTLEDGFVRGAKWYREQLKTKKINYE